MDMAAAIADTAIDAMETAMEIPMPDIPKPFHLEPYDVERPSLEDDPAFM